MIMKTTLLTLAVVFVVAVADDEKEARFLIAPKSLKPSGKIPAVGYGTSAHHGEVLEKAMEAAFDAGYRHFDTASIYENEKDIGNILKKWLSTGKVKREDLFIVTKLPPIGNRPEGVTKYLTKSLEDLQLDYVDMYLIHSPVGLKNTGNTDIPELLKKGQIDPTTDLLAIWKAMEAQVESGKIKAIGLSNFNISQIQKIIDHSKIKPANLQVELHAYHQQKPLVEFAKKNGIVVTAYSPLGNPGYLKTLQQSGQHKDLVDVLKNPLVQQIAKKHGTTEAQVVLRHGLQRGLVVIPSSSNPQRIKQNIDVFKFKLDDDDLKQLGALDGKVRLFNLKSSPGALEHPEFPFHDNE